MRIIRVDEREADPQAIRAAVQAIRRGELVIFPTETVYGLAADAANEEAVRKVFAAKGRGEGHPLSVQIASARMLDQVAGFVSEAARALAEEFWPGPLTLILPRSARISDAVSGGLDTIGVRVPDHVIALALLREFGGPIVATSANISGQSAPTSAERAIRNLGEAAALALDSGECRLGVASTVVDVSACPPRIIRQGSISAEEIETVTSNE